eukprot:4702115-Amphidinium_carterae.2
MQRAKKGPSKGNSSEKGSRPNSDDRGRSPSPGAGGSAKGSSKGRSGSNVDSNDKNGGNGKPRGKSPGQSPKSDGKGTRREQVPIRLGPLLLHLIINFHFGNALLDSGASHVILPLNNNELSPEGKKHAKQVKLQLASGSGKDSLMYESEVYADRVRRPLIPLESDGLDSLFRAKLRQAALPHVSRRIAIVLRCALRDTRDHPRVIDASEWHSRMGEAY